MKENFKKAAIIAEKIKVLFPIVSSSNRWRLWFGTFDGEFHEALNNVSLFVPRGKILGVIGKNGAGKSTLLRSLAGLYPLSSGRVIRLGQVNSLFELGGIGNVLLTGEDYVKRWLSINGVNKREWNKYIDDIREFSELGSRLEDRLYTYSAGMAARLYFSTATCISHEIYLIDEILSVGDEHFQVKCWERIRNQLDSGVSGVLVTHDWAAVLRLCENACELKDGKIVAQGVSQRIVTDYLRLSFQPPSDCPAHFSDGCQTSFTVASGDDWIADFTINITSDRAVFFGYSIEKLEIGREWQILFFGPETPVGDSAGKYSARISVPSIPLPGGEYLLSIFLFDPKIVAGSRETYDLRSWTVGSGLRLNVTGEKTSGLVQMPMKLEAC